MPDAPAPTQKSPYSDFQLLDSVDPQGNQRPAPYTRFVQVGLTEDGTIECTFHVAEVTKVGDFEAVSYTWGPALPTKEVILNGQKFAIRKNLWCALHTILRDRETRQIELGTSNVSPYLWIDALSIDQNNVLERNHQVQHMREIYSKAKLVLVWVENDDGANVDTAVQELRRHKPARPDAQDLNNLAPQTLGALRTLLSQSYWTRMWIVQEFVMAKDIRFLYGDKNFSWRDFKYTMLYLDESNVAIHCQTNKNKKVAAHYQYIRDSSAFSIYRIRKMHEDGAVFDIFELISSFHRQQCSDPRDKVFALLGLAKPAWERIRVDYSLTNEMVLSNVLLSFSLSEEDKRSEEEIVKLLSELTDGPRESMFEDELGTREEKPQKKKATRGWVRFRTSVSSFYHNPIWRKLSFH